MRTAPLFNVTFSLNAQGTDRTGDRLWKSSSGQEALTLTPRETPRGLFRGCSQQMGRNTNLCSNCGPLTRCSVSDRPAILSRLDRLPHFVSGTLTELQRPAYQDVGSTTPSQMSDVATFSLRDAATCVMLQHSPDEVVKGPESGLLLMALEVVQTEYTPGEREPIHMSSPTILYYA